MSDTDTITTRVLDALISTSVVTGDQNAYGSGWEIGAFIYVPAVAVNPPSNLHAVAH